MYEALWRLAHFIVDCALGYAILMCVVGARVLLQHSKR